MVDAAPPRCECLGLKCWLLFKRSPIAGVCRGARSLSCSLGFLGCKSIHKNFKKRRAEGQIKFKKHSICANLVRIILLVCRECLSVWVAEGGGMPWMKRLGYCAGSKNSNSENWTCP